MTTEHAQLVTVQAGAAKLVRIQAAAAKIVASQAAAVSVELVTCHPAAMKLVIQHRDCTNCPRMIHHTSLTLLQRQTHTTTAPTECAKLLVTGDTGT